MRFARALWPIVFLVPLPWWADRGCSIAGVDPFYHSILWIHERLGWFVAMLAAISAMVVASKIIVARVRLRRLLALCDTPPAHVSDAFQRASLELGIRLPTVAYLNLTTPLATTVFGPIVLISRGFIEGLSSDDLRLVARHELAHAGRRDARSGVLWHLAFTALLIPGFESLERRLHADRERQANLLAARGEEAAYLDLVRRVAPGPALCVDAGLGVESAARRPEDAWLAWISPAIVVTLAVALSLSHLAFRHNEAYLISHHC